MHEILHLSFSARANHLSTHFFNVQESYFTYVADTDDLVETGAAGNNFTVANEALAASAEARRRHRRSRVDHYVSFRPGIGADGVTQTFTPRCMLWDLRGGQGSLAKYNALYDYGQETLSRNVVRMEQARIPQSAYIRALDSNTSEIPRVTRQTAQYWSDYNNVFHHPRSLLQLSEWTYDPITAPKGRTRGAAASTKKSPTTEFRTYGVGRAAYETDGGVDGVGSGAEALHSGFRQMLEECDLLAGINVVVDVDSGWGGFAALALEDVRDEFVPKNTIAVWGLEDSGALDTREEQYSRIESVVGLCEPATIYIPLSLPASLARSDWEDTALLAEAFETLTLPGRLKASSPGRVDMGEFAAFLSGAGARRIADSVRLAPSGGEAVALGWENSANDKWFDRRARREYQQRRRASTHVFARAGVARDGGCDEAAMLAALETRCEAARVREEGGQVREAVVGGLAYPRLATAPALQRESAEPTVAWAASGRQGRAVVTEMAGFVARCRGDERAALAEALAERSEEQAWGWSEGESQEEE
ncbi:tubulin domain-containing protein [Limtongia smithiae]|uniref:tubulin domain-containing protein n=1 Tax=Limtongia smithiae TaxID=1125753 RepID=UPI0034CEC054